MLTDNIRDIYMRAAIFMRAAVAAILVLSSVAANAGAASASISNLHVKVIDLRPDDGIAPNVTLILPGGTFGSIYAYGIATLIGTSEDYQASFGGAINVPPVGNFGSGHSNTGNIFDLSAQGWTASMSIDVKAPAQVVLGNMSTSVGLNVSPYTAVEVSAQVGGLAVMSATPADTLEASIYLEYNGDRYVSSGVSHVSYNGASRFYTITDGHSVEVPSIPNSLSATFANETGQEVTTALDARMVTSGTAYLPVPEPQSAALLLVGLAVMVIRRRQTHRISRLCCCRDNRTGWAYNGGESQIDLLRGTARSRARVRA